MPFQYSSKALNDRHVSGFKWYHDRFTGHYSKKLNVEFRNIFR